MWHTQFWMDVHGYSWRIWTLSALYFNRIFFKTLDLWFIRIIFNLPTTINIVILSRQKWVNVTDKNIYSFFQSPLSLEIISKYHLLKFSLHTVSRYQHFQWDNVYTLILYPNDKIKFTATGGLLTSISKRLNMLDSAISLDSSNFSKAWRSSSSGILPCRFFL